MTRKNYTDKEHKESRSIKNKAENTQESRHIKLNGMNKDQLQ